MSPKRVFYVMLGAVVLLVGVSAFVTYTGRKLIIDEGQKLTTLKLDKEVLKRRTTALEQANKYITSYEGLEQIARSVVPQDKDQARIVVELDNMARESGISITNISFPSSLLGQSGSGKKKVNIDPNLTQLTELPNLKGVYSMEIRLDTDEDQPVAYSRLINFLSKLENNRRTAQVTRIDITPDKDNRSLITFELTLTTYIKP